MRNFCFTTKSFDEIGIHAEVNWRKFFFTKFTEFIYSPYYSLVCVRKTSDSLDSVLQLCTIDRSDAIFNVDPFRLSSWPILDIWFASSSINTRIFLNRVHFIAIFSPFGEFRRIIIFLRSQITSLNTMWHFMIRKFRSL